MSTSEKSHTTEHRITCRFLYLTDDINELEGYEPQEEDIESCPCQHPFTHFKKCSTVELTLTFKIQ